MPLQPRFPSFSRARALGFSLIEVVAAIGILAIAMGAVFMGLGLAVDKGMVNLYTQTAHNAAQGYLNQILMMPSTDLKAVLSDPTRTTLDTHSLQWSSTGGLAWLPDPLVLNGVNHLPTDNNPTINQPQAALNSKSILFRYDPKNSAIVQTMPMDFTVYLSDLSLPSNPVQGYSVLIEAEYEVPIFGKKASQKVTVGGVNHAR
jgi:prepilin-type N-terminal cleavage/methylation domain-containing protein